MPSGPSHSASSSGGGSHGGSFGGGGFGGSHGGNSGGYAPRPRHPITFHWFGRPIIISTGAQNTLVTLIMFFLVCALFGIFSIVGYSSNMEEVNKNNQLIAVYETDAVYYQNLITKAKNGEEGYYLTTATFDNKIYSSYDEDDYAGTGAFQYQYIGGLYYYFINYEYINNREQGMKGETYTQFTSSQIKNMISGNTGSIEIAYTYDASEGGYVSINTSYSLKENQDYNVLKMEIENNDSGSTFLVVGIIFIIAGVGILIGMVFVIRKQIKKSKEQAEIDEAKQKAEIAEANANAERAKADANKRNRVCAYCGAPVPDGETKCPACGARHFEKQK